MLKRTIYIASPARLSMKDRQIVCVNKDDESDVRSAPIEDLGCIIVENQRVTMTIPLMNALAENNTAVVFCNGNTMPTSILVSLDANTTQRETHRAQKNASEPLKKSIWKQIVTAKIKNQAALLDKLGKDGAILKPYYANVKSGDSDNREGAAARLYWRLLFGEAFIRDRDGDSPNNLLNYGYSILRAATVRALLGSGLSPGESVFHRNRYNAMPLADDLMEPFRPFVDEIVHSLFFSGKRELTTEVKTKLAAVLVADTIVGQLMRPLEIGLTWSASSLGKVFLGDKKLVSLPKLE